MCCERAARKNAAAMPLPLPPRPWDPRFHCAAVLQHITQRVNAEAGSGANHFSRTSCTFQHSTMSHMHTPFTVFFLWAATCTSVVCCSSPVQLRQEPHPVSALVLCLYLSVSLCLAFFLLISTLVLLLVQQIEIVLTIVFVGGFSLLFGTASSYCL